MQIQSNNLNAQQPSVAPATENQGDCFKFRCRTVAVACGAIAGIGLGGCLGGIALGVCGGVKGPEDWHLHFRTHDTPLCNSSPQSYMEVMKHMAVIPGLFGGAAIGGLVGAAGAYGLFNLADGVITLGKKLFNFAITIPEANNSVLSADQQPADLSSVTPEHNTDKPIVIGQGGEDKEKNKDV